MDAIDTVSDVGEYFYRYVHEAIYNQRVEALPETEFYLVNLLSRFSNTERLYLDYGREQEEQALYKLLERAMEADRQSRIILLRRLGDIALYFAGYFPESLSRKLIDLNYYIQMGGIAYESVSNLIIQSHQHDLYHELSAKFCSWVDILGEVSAESFSHTEQDLLKLYEYWLQTGNRVAEVLLNKKGIILHSGGEESQ